MTIPRALVASAMLAACPGVHAETWLEGRLEGDTAWSASRGSAQAHAKDFKLYWKGAAPGGMGPAGTAIPSWAKPSAGLAWMGALGEIHVGSLGGVTREPRSSSRSVFTVAPSRGRPGIGGGANVQGIGWVARGRRAHAAWGLDEAGGWRAHFGVGRARRGRSAWDVRAFLDQRGAGDLAIAARTREIAMSVSAARTEAESRIALGMGDREGAAALRATWTSTREAAWADVGIGAGVTRGALSGTRAEVLCAGPGAPIAAPRGAARATLRAAYGAWLAALSGSVRTWRSGSMRGIAEWSMTRESPQVGSITVSLAMEPGFEGPSAAAIAWRAPPHNIRWTGHAEISALRGRIFHLALEAGTESRARIEVRVQDRAFQRPRVGIEIGVRRTFDTSHTERATSSD